MRIVTRPDFDGIVCAAILKEAYPIQEPILWAEPGDMQRGRITINEGDIIANLPYHEKCALWFDHHYSAKIDNPFEGIYQIAPSAAGLVYNYLEDKLPNDFGELIRETDRIDSADLTLDEVLYPEKYPYVLLSMTVSGRDREDEPYWNLLVDALLGDKIEVILAIPEVKKRIKAVAESNKRYAKHLAQNTARDGCVSVTDFRSIHPAPDGNRFLVYSIIPDAVVNVKVYYDHLNPARVVLKAGHSIFNQNCHVNLGLLLSQYGGGGHRGAASCRFDKSLEKSYINEIMAVLRKNKDNENCGEN